MRRVDGVQAHRVDGLHAWMHTSEAILNDLANMVILDFLIGNTDRHEGNWFVTNAGRIMAIDNGFAGKDPLVPMKRCLRPVKASGVYHDPDLWPKFLLAMDTVAEVAEGHGHEVRELSDRIGFHAQEAKDLANLWEIKLARLRAEIRKELGKQVGK